MSVRSLRHSDGYLKAACGSPDGHHQIQTPKPPGRCAGDVLSPRGLIIAGTAWQLFKIRQQPFISTGTTRSLLYRRNVNVRSLPDCLMASGSYKISHRCNCRPVTFKDVSKAKMNIRPGAFHFKKADWISNICKNWASALGYVTIAYMMVVISRWVYVTSWKKYFHEGRIHE